MANLVSCSSASAVLAREVDIRVADTVVARQCIRPAKRLLFCAEVAAHLLLPRIVYGILVPGQIVRPGEDCVARLARARVDAFTFVWACLGIQECRRHASSWVWFARRTQAVSLSVTLTLVLL
jgi:hypothetical protein